MLNYIISDFGTIYFPHKKKYFKHESYSLQVIRTNSFERAEVMGGMAFTRHFSKIQIIKKNILTWYI